MEQIKIDLVPNGVMSVAHASQFDVGRSMKFLLTDEGVTYTLAGTEVITMKLCKPDGTDDTISLVNTSSSYVEWTTVDGDLDLSGVYLAEITITSGDDVLGTANFLLKVEPDPYNGKNIRIVTVGPADICTFETTLPEPYQSVTVNVVATGGNGTPDNPNPIVGYSSANITRCGVNLWDEEWENGDISSSTGEKTAGSLVITKNFIPVKPNTVCYSNITLRTRWYDAQKNYIGTDPTITANATFTVPANAHYLMFTTQAGYGSTYNNDISINYPSTDTTYHAYNGQTYTIAFGQTVYGGVLDVTRGKLHVTWGDVDLGSLSWTHRTDVAQGVFAAQLPDYKFSSDVYAICENYEFRGTAVSSTIVSHGNDCVLLYFDNQQTARYVYVYDTAYSDANTFKTAMDGVKFVYELATPFDIDLTPTQIRALVGENNVFADCGETEVEYLTEE